MTGRRLRGDRGQVGGIEVLPLGLLVLVAGSLVVAGAWGVVDARFAVSRAAREGVRAYVEAPDAASAERAARVRALETLAAHGRDDERAVIGPLDAPEGFRRCARVRLTVAYEVPAVTVPFLGGIGAATTVSATHTEIVDPFRSGLEGAAACG